MSLSDKHPKLALRLLLLWQVGIYPLYLFLFHFTPDLFWLFLILERPFYFFRSKNNYMENLLDHYAMENPWFMKVQIALMFYSLAMLGTLYMMSEELFLAIISMEIFDFLLLMSYKLINRRKQQRMA